MQVKRGLGYECLSGVVQAFQVDWLMMILGRVEKGNDRVVGSAIEHANVGAAVVMNNAAGYQWGLKLIVVL